MEGIDTLYASNHFWKKGTSRSVSARGTSRGITTFWDISTFDLLEEESCMHWLFTKLLHKIFGLKVSLFNLYVPAMFSEKRSCWDSIKTFLTLHNPENVTLAGDLNITLAVEEKKGALWSEILQENG